MKGDMIENDWVIWEDFPAELRWGSLVKTSHIRI